MTSSLLPENAVQAGGITIVTYFKDSGALGVHYDIDGMGREEAIGRLTVIVDRLREEIKWDWDTCPGCGELWESHDEDED